MSGGVIRVNQSSQGTIAWFFRNVKFSGTSYGLVGSQARVGGYSIDEKGRSPIRGCRQRRGMITGRRPFAVTGKSLTDRRLWWPAGGGLTHGGSLRDEATNGVVTNFQTERSPADFALMYKEDNLTGGHVIALGPGNEKAALSALCAFPGGMQMGGGISPDNAMIYLDAGASHVIVTSYVFSDGNVDMDRLKTLVKAVGKSRLVLDLSCRSRDSAFWIVTDRWQNFTNVPVATETLVRLSRYCDEFLVHGVDVEGKMQGIESELVEILGENSPIPVTYAGGVRNLSDLDRVKKLGQNRVDVTVGSALDIFGGRILYRDVVRWHQANLEK